MARSADPTEPIRLAASKYAGVDKGTSCTQSSFKAGGQAFLYCGPQGGRFKAMFKLGSSRAQAEQLARKQPERFDVGSTAWITARFTPDEPMPRKLWKAWLDESYALSTAGKTGTKKKAATKKAARKTTKKKAAAKKVARKATTKKATAKKAATRRR
jgi:hypothetical protein